MPNPTRSILLAAFGATLMLGVAACGGSATSQTATPAVTASSAATTAASSAGGRDFTAFRDCMAKNGVALPDFAASGGGGTPPSGMPTAPPSGMPSGAPGGFPADVPAECASLMPARGPGGGGPGGPAGIDETAIAAFKSCLSDHYVVVSDGQDWMRKLDRTDAKVKAALDTCAPLLPQPTASASASAAQ